MEPSQCGEREGNGEKEKREGKGREGTAEGPSGTVSLVSVSIHAMSLGLRCWLLLIPLHGE